jgi:hypothetical protein
MLVGSACSFGADEYGAEIPGPNDGTGAEWPRVAAEKGNAKGKLGRGSLDKLDRDRPALHTCVNPIRILICTY